MEPYSTLEATSLPAGAKTVVASAGAQIAELYPEQAVQPTNSNRTVQASVSAALAAARAETKARLAAGNLASGVRFPGEDGGHSLAEMAQRDLDAALQLLADRAQYITGASGAAIALRRNGKNDMLCRASSGSNAPELGALLSTEFGLSGESVRTRQPLRCDDAERDARVNRDVCREMGIASVVVMPVVNDDEVLGVFELFSGKTNAFGARDLSAIQRLSEMVETAVRLAQATESLPERLKMPQVSESELKAAPQDQVLEADVLEDILLDEPVLEARVSTDPVSKGPIPHAAASEKAPVAPVKKPLFWSAALNPAADTVKSEDLDQSHVPPVLRSLHKCEACGFPVSAGRALCVECEEKKWRGQLRVPKPASKPEASKPESSKAESPKAESPKDEEQKAADRPVSPVASSSAAVATSFSTAYESKSAAEQVVIPASAPSPAVAETTVAAAATETASPEFVLSAGLQPSQSWLARNKYIVGVILAVGAAAAGFFLLR